MQKRPISVIVIACLYIATGALGLIFHGRELIARHVFESDTVLIPAVEIAAIIAGIYLLRGHNWARWLALAWMAFHVVLSFYHPWSELAMHALLLAVFAYLLFRPEANRYFSSRSPLSGNA